jgi:hypothetical protein
VKWVLFGLSSELKRELKIPILSFGSAAAPATTSYNARDESGELSEQSEQSEA